MDIKLTNERNFSPKSDTKINIIRFSYQTSEINISVSRYFTESYLYLKQSYGKQCSQEYVLSFQTIYLAWTMRLKHCNVFFETPCSQKFSLEVV